jgi:hypothetical protein
MLFWNYLYNVYLHLCVFYLSAIDKFAILFLITFFYLVISSFCLSFWLCRTFHLFFVCFFSLCLDILSVCLSVFLFWFWLSVCLSYLCGTFCLSACLSFWFVWASMSVSFSLYIYQSLCLFFWFLFVFLLVCLSFSLSLWFVFNLMCKWHSSFFSVFFDFQTSLLLLACQDEERNQ